MRNKVILLMVVLVITVYRVISGVSAKTVSPMSEELRFSNYLTKEVEKITIRNSGGETLSITDSSLINRMIETMDSKTYKRASNPGLTGSTTMNFYSADNKEVVRITFVGEYFYVNDESNLPIREIKEVMKNNSIKKCGIN